MNALCLEENRRRSIEYDRPQPLRTAPPIITSIVPGFRKRIGKPLGRDSKKWMYLVTDARTRPPFYGRVLLSIHLHKKSDHRSDHSEYIVFD